MLNLNFVMTQYADSKAFASSGSAREVSQDSKHFLKL